MPQFPHLENEDNDSNYLMKVLVRLTELMFIEYIT